jgi:hypothetical protein
VEEAVRADEGSQCPKDVTLTILLRLDVIHDFCLQTFFFPQRVCDFIQASVETNVKAKGRAKQRREQSKRAIPGETK